MYDTVCAYLHVVYISVIHPTGTPLLWQCVAVCCSVLQCVAVCCSVLQRVGVKGLGRHVVERTLLVAVCCSVLQCVAVRWDTLWGTYTVCAYLHVAYMLCYLT